MRREKSVKLGKLLKDYFSDVDKSGGMLTARVLRAWDEIMEPDIVKATADKYFNNKTLYVTISSSILRSLVLGKRKEVLFELNRHLGGCYIQSILLK